jgi:hypothetical protein
VIIEFSDSLKLYLIDNQGKFKNIVEYKEKQIHDNWDRTITYSAENLKIAYLVKQNFEKAIMLHVFNHDLIELRSELIQIENMVDLVSLDFENARYYILVKHQLKEFKWCTLAIYTENFDLIQVKGDSKDTKNPFYFDWFVEVVKVKQEKLYILREGTIIIKNENSGQTISQIYNCFSNFLPLNNSDLMIFDNKNKVFIKNIYDRLKFQIVVPHDENFAKSQFSHESLIYFYTHNYSKAYLLTNNVNIRKHKLLPKFLISNTIQEQKHSA